MEASDSRWLQDETVRVLQRLIRFDTVNPPGNEREAQEWLAGYLREAGFEVELIGAEPERPNLIARLRGAEPGPTLCYLSHMDTVLAEPSEWRHDPWSGDVADGFLWGRGAIDMKNQTAAEVVGAVALARAGGIARGELTIVCVVDEEVGGILGAKWLTENHPDKVRCDMLLNEGAGPVIPYDGRRVYGVCCAEKGTFRFTVTTGGTAAHASTPALGDNALVKLAPVLQRLAERTPGWDVTAEPAALLAALTGDGAEPAAALEQVRAVDPGVATLIEPMLGVTFAPTRIRASEKINVIPSLAELKVDCRVPPGLGEAEARRRIEEVLGRGDGADGGAAFRIDFMEQVVGNRSPMASPLMDAIGAWLGEVDPGAETAPVILPGFTDSRWFRKAFPDCVAYGFFPQKHMTLHETSPLFHAADERIDVRDLGFAARFFAELPERVLA